MRPDDLTFALRTIQVFEFLQHEKQIMHMLLFKPFSKVHFFLIVVDGEMHFFYLSSNHCFSDTSEHNKNQLAEICNPSQQTCFHLYFLLKKIHCHWAAVHLKALIPWRLFSAGAFKWWWEVPWSEGQVFNGVICICAILSENKAMTLMSAGQLYYQAQQYEEVGGGVVCMFFILQYVHFSN